VILNEHIISNEICRIFFAKGNCLLCEEIFYFRQDFKMKTSLDYLPVNKQQDIQAITEIIKEVTKPEKIILFGSYATGKYVEDRYVEDNIVYEYRSDYDFLIVTNGVGEREFVLNDRIKTRCRGFNTPVNTIIHDVSYVNEGLSLGQYFFTDIVKEGILLYDTRKMQFSELKELTPAERKSIATEYFDQWYENASEFLDFAEFGFQNAVKENKRLNNVAFLLHQAAEAFYATILLVYTGYKPKTHNLERLRTLAKPLSPDLYQLFLFPEGDKEQEHIFGLLISAYVNARYKRDYVITKEDAEDILNRLRRMKEVVKKACTGFLDSL